MMRIDEPLFNVGIGVAMLAGITIAARKYARNKIVWAILFFVQRRRRGLQFMSF
jgi:hypothetical protein